MNVTVFNYVLSCMVVCYLCLMHLSCICVSLQFIIFKHFLLVLLVFCQIASYLLLFLCNYSVYSLCDYVVSVWYHILVVILFFYLCFRHHWKRGFALWFLEMWIKVELFAHHDRLPPPPSSATVTTSSSRRDHQHQPPWQPAVAMVTTSSSRPHHQQHPLKIKHSSLHERE